MIASEISVAWLCKYYAKGAIYSRPYGWMEDTYNAKSVENRAVNKKRAKAEATKAKAVAG